MFRVLDEGLLLLLVLLDLVLLELLLGLEVLLLLLRQQLLLLPAIWKGLSGRVSCRKRKQLLVRQL